VLRRRSRAAKLTTLNQERAQTQRGWTTCGLPLGTIRPMGCLAFSRWLRKCHAQENEDQGPAAAGPFTRRLSAVCGREREAMPCHADQAEAQQGGAVNAGQSVGEACGSG
jgi:hypothetical protein